MPGKKDGDVIRFNLKIRKKPYSILKELSDATEKNVTEIINDAIDLYISTNKEEITESINSRRNELDEVINKICEKK